MADECDVIAKNGKLFAIVNGVHVPVKMSPEAIAAVKKGQKASASSEEDDDSTESESASRKAAARRSPSNPNWSPNPVDLAASDAGRRFDSEEVVRRTFGVGLQAKPGSEEYDGARQRYVAAARKHAKG